MDNQLGLWTVIKKDCSVGYIFVEYTLRGRNIDNGLGLRTVMLDGNNG